MKMQTNTAHTTNYTDAFVAVEDDTTAKEGEMPPVKEGKLTAANIQFDMLLDNPYKYTSDDVLFHVYAVKNELKKNELAAARKEFFSKGQACMRASPLTKRYGWGVHSDDKGRIAIYGMETPEYKKLVKDKNLLVMKAMKSKR